MADMTIKQLAVAVYKKQAPTNFSLNDMEGALRDKFRELASDFNTYRRNKIEIFELIEQVIDEVAPKKIIEAIGMFAEVKTYGQGERARFKRKLGRNNVRRFITRVGLGGIYERVRLDSDYVDVATHAYGGAAYVEFEQFLDGTMDFTDLVNLIIDGIEYKILEEVQAALIATFNGLPAANKASGAAFDAAEMRRLITTIKAYGGNANIICTPEFAGTITPASGFVGDPDKADMRNQGYIGRFEGANVIVLPQSFTDSSNTTKVLNPQFAFIVPTGGTEDEKIVKVALEGQTVVKEVQNADDSMEFQAYKKIGSNILFTNYFAVYKNTALQ
ncbi:hypothetical protein PC41400_14490 [Paenibacillus chitinolyticus]|uniref:Uncharacterized protein n=1 Tax=Paenibacillus chitinolyticus TaxID=79263 RepID=A0A410WX61_9BACL|nr:hypothetical protein [Paenibacillus chitinolyticus]MCY9594004.1 hypothetical protein [Paenibacillus chitinolyticus]MCY9598549.1 hypothetical protein [Paenibacillus chitinolyticus]QAV18821.1 hypothetical protein PC41400_14490 [Paenibacillus chitinolyticus]